MNLIGKEVYVKNEGWGIVVGYDGYGTYYIVDLKQGGTVEVMIEHFTQIKWEG